MEGTDAVVDPLSAPPIIEVDTAPAPEKRSSAGLLSFFGGGSSVHSSRRGSLRNDDSDSETDNFSTIGQIVGPPSKDETAMFEKVTKVGEDAQKEKPDFYIRVTDPRKTDQPGFFGLNSVYMQYKIITARANAEIVVWRRFREFVALDDLLAYKFNGYIVPPRPEKNAVEAQRMKGTFIQERQLALEKYLNRLAIHPEIKNSEELRVFLEMEGSLASSTRWRALQPSRASFFELSSRFSRQLFGREGSFIRPNEVTNSGKRNYMLSMKERIQYMKNEFQGATANDIDEKALNRRAQYIGAKSDQLTELSRFAETLVKKFDRMSGILGDMGLALIRLSKFEEEGGMELARYTASMESTQALTNNTKQSGIALIRLARLARKVTAKMALDLSEIHEYLFLMPSVQRALASRYHALLTLQVVKNQRSTRQKRLEELQASNEQKLGGSASKTRRIKYVTEQIGILDETVTVAENEYQRVKTANYTDLERYDKQREKDFLKMIENLACVQTAYSERSVEVWIEIAKALEATEDQVRQVTQ